MEDFPESYYVIENLNKEYDDLENSFNNHIKRQFNSVLRNIDINSMDRLKNIYMPFFVGFPPDPSRDWFFDELYYQNLDYLMECFISHKRIHAMTEDEDYDDYDDVWVYELKPTSFIKPDRENFESNQGWIAEPEESEPIFVYSRKTTITHAFEERESIKHQLQNYKYESV
jgi:hypothetical protein